MEFIIKPETDLTKYGFEKRSDDCWYWWRKDNHRGALNIIVSNGRLLIPSASKDCIAVICEMYKNGDIEIVSNDTFFTMKLTKEEVELINSRRSKQ